MCEGKEFLLAALPVLVFLGRFRMRACAATYRSADVWWLCAAYKHKRTLFLRLGYGMGTGRAQQTADREPSPRL
uniref:EC63 protein n=1 Tax=Colletotrichum higginsianum TaxID=80884 RepID=I2G7E3_9PEZI|nr:EC63 protein [Colletotrichum higginsianum]